MAMTLRLSTDEDRALVLLASAWGCSKQEAAKRAIITSATRLLDDATVDQLAREVIAEANPPGRHHPRREDLATRIDNARRTRTSITFDSGEEGSR